uniref:TOG domain-containing protein n=1 Tax=Haemonchus contortus TaxID=6289 RepID=A0A7I4YRM5_HAECO|nr:HEAT domain containing protein [Haemonchus contortus]
MDSLLGPMPLRPDRLPSPAFMPRDDDYAELLRSNDFDIRLQTLNRLGGLSRRDPDWFTHCARKGELFKNIDRILMDDRWEVQHQCIKFLYEAMPTFGSNLEYCVCYLMPNLLPKLGSSKITVRKVSIQALQAFLRLQPEALGSMLKTLSNFLLTSTDRTTKADVVREFPAMFIPELINSDWSNLLDSLTKLMGTTDGETAENAAITAKKLEVYLGKNAFERILLSLPSIQQKDYARFSKNVVTPEGPATRAPPQVVTRNTFKLASGERRFRFGIVPSVIAAMVIDNTDAVTRISGLEKWKLLIENITSEEISRLVPHLHSYLMSLGNVLTELNFKVVVLALDVVRLTVNRLKSFIEAHLQQVLSLISQHFGNQKAVIKQLIMMTCMDLFQNINPKAVVGALSVYLENRNSRVREEVVNILTSALMTTSSSKINFIAVLNMLIPLLLDPKRRVRLAAFEQLSVVGYLMNGKMDTLLRTIREAETRHGAKGLTSAVMARLHRQSLPRIRYDGLIEYSTPPVNDSSFGVSDSELDSDENLDLNWILHGGETMPNRPISPMSMVAGITRAIVATKSHKATLPWINEKDDATCAVTLNRMKSDDQIVRRQDASAILNPNLSTSSWHTPKRNNSLISEDRSVSAAINRMAQRNAEAAHMQNGEAPTELGKKVELNNNHVPIKKQVPSSPSTLAKAKSEGNLIEEVENNPPVNFDDVPIKPAKGGKYFDDDLNELSNGTAGYGTLAKKSTSHHSLPVTATHTTLKNVKSTPVRKQQSTTKVLPAAQPKSSAPNKFQPTPAARTLQTTGPKTVVNALKKIESEDWCQKVEGINMITELSATNPKDVSDHMHEVVLAILNECKNLRSGVSRVALSCIGTLTQNMKNKMDMELDKLCMILINKAGDVSNAFIREDANEALTKVVNYASANKALQAIITAGSKSKNNTTRASCASFVGTLVSRLGTAAVLSSPDQLSKLVTQLLAFSRDPNPHVRMYGKQTLVYLSQDANFDRQLKKAVSDAEYRAVRAILDDIDKKGLDSLDSTCTSLGSSLSRSGSMRKAVQRKLPDNVQLDLDEIRADLTAAGWERRLGGLKRFEEMCCTAAKAVASDTKLIEAFIGRLNDINSKVSLEGLDTYMVSLPSLSKAYSTEAHLKAVLNQLILALMSHLSSKSDEHRKTAQKCLSETIRRVDPASLSPAIAAATRKANIKQKPFMLNLFNRLNVMLYPTKPKQVEVVALPILWECLKTGVADSEIKKALTEFAKGLVDLMSERALLDQASMELDPSRRRLLESLIR